MKWVRWTLALQVVFFLGWALSEEMKRQDAPTVVLETEPYDPRDLLAGKYMDLRYQAGDTSKMPGIQRDGTPVGSKVWVNLEPAGQARIAEKVYQVWKPTICSLDSIPAPLKDRGVWITGTYVGGFRIRYGIERYYFSEKNQADMNGIRSGHVWVEATVSKKGQLSLSHLLY